MGFQGQGSTSSLGSSVPATVLAPSNCSINVCCMTSRLYLEVLLPLKPFRVFFRDHPALAPPGPVRTPEHTPHIKEERVFQHFSLALKKTCLGSLTLNVPVTIPSVRPD